MSDNDTGHFSAEGLPNSDNQERTGSVDYFGMMETVSEEVPRKDEVESDSVSKVETEAKTGAGARTEISLIPRTGMAETSSLPKAEEMSAKSEAEDAKEEVIQYPESTEPLFHSASEVGQENPEVKEPGVVEEAYMPDVADGKSETLGDSNPLTGEDSSLLSVEEHSGSIKMPESSLPYKLWIDAKSRDWILEWQTKNGRWSVRKFSCKRWGKGKAYSHAMNFLASLTSCGIIKDSNFGQLGESGESMGESMGESIDQINRTVEDELVLQFLSQRDEVANAERQKGGSFGSSSGLNTLAAIAAAAAAAAIASTPSKSRSPSKNGASSQLSASSAASPAAQPQTRGAVRKSGVPGVYWSQKPQGWRVVYYTGKDREFEYFKVPANASEEVINEILEVAKRFRSQVTAEGRHLPNGAVGSSSKRARMAERKAAAAAAASSAPDASRHLLQSRAAHFSEEGIVDYLKSPPDIASKGILDMDPMSPFASKFSPGNVAGIQSPVGAMPSCSYEWLYNPLLMNLYGNYSAATQAAAMQQWAMLQNTFSQNGGMLSSAIPGQVDGAAPQTNPMLNSFLPNPFINPFGLQMPTIMGQNAGLLAQIPQVPNVNASAPMNMNMFGRYYGVPVSPGQTSQPQMTSPTCQSGDSASPVPPYTDSSSWLNQPGLVQQLLPNPDQLAQESSSLVDAFNAAASRVEDACPSLKTETANKPSENLLEVQSSSNNTSS